MEAWVSRLQQYVNRELSDSRVGFRKGRGTREQIANIRWIIEKARNSRKTSTSASLTMLKPLTMWIITNCGKFFKRWESVQLLSRVRLFVTHEAEIDVFLEFSCFFYDPTDVGYLISGSCAFSKSSLNIWNCEHCSQFMVIGH